MKKKFTAVFAIIVITALLVPIDTVKPSTSLFRHEHKEKKWTFMIYDCGDSLFTPLASRWLMNNIRTNKDINIIILQDSSYGPDRIVRINKFGLKRTEKVFDEVSTSNPETLKDFVSYCKENYPAQRYFLDIVSHGVSWLGACLDENLHDNKKDGEQDEHVMSVDELAKAINETGGVDILAKFFSCGMANIEFAYELRNCVEVLIARETIGKDPDRHTYKSVVNILKNNLDLSNIEIAEEIIKETGKNEEKLNIPISKKTLSAIRLDKLGNLVASIDNLANNLMNNYKQHQIHISYIHNELKCFYPGSGGQWHTVDIFDLVDNYQKLEGMNQSIYDSLEDVKNSLNLTVISEWHNSNWKNAHGLTINYPKWIPSCEIKLGGYWNNSLEYYSSCGIDFTNDSMWDEFLSLRDLNFKTVSNNKGDYNKIQDAINNASHGDTVYLLQGAYKENIVINKSINLIGRDNKAIIVGNGLEDVIRIDSDDVELAYLQIKNSGENQAGIKIHGNSTGIYWCNINNNSYGLVLESSSNNEIIHNEIKDNNRFGIFLLNSYNNKFEYNNFIKNNRHISFINSNKNKWRNMYKPHRFFNIIIGYRKIGNVKIPSISIDKCWPQIL